MLNFIIVENVETFSNPFTNKLMFKNTIANIPVNTNCPRGYLLAISFLI